MEMKKPYYMTYDIPEIWHEEYMSRRDLEYMKGIYPEIVKLLLPFIENECAIQELCRRREQYREKKRRRCI